MVDQDAGTTPETAPAPSLLVDGNETITADTRREDGSNAAADEGRTVGEDEREETRSGDASHISAALRDSSEVTEIAGAPMDTTISGKEAAQDLGATDRAAVSTGEASQPDDQRASSPMLASQTDAPPATAQADPETTLPSTAPRAASIQASSTIHRTASPAYSQSSVTSTQGNQSVASPSLAAPKKFSTVNINKKFLAKTGGAAPASTGTASSQPGNKESGLGLVNLSGKP